MQVLEGKVAVITGGSSGNRAGYRQAVPASRREGGDFRSQPEIARRCSEGARSQGNNSAFGCEQTARLGYSVDIITKKLGHIDVLFPNAGSAKFAPGSDTSEAFYNEIFDINVKGVFFTIQKAIPFLNDGASIILNTSVANQSGLPNTSAYAASKAAVRSFARSIGAELAAKGIRVNVVSPGPISTPMYEKLGLPKETVEAFAANIVSQVPLKRFGTPDEVANTALFLASSASSYITGVELNVDGGMGQV